MGGKHRRSHPRSLRLAQPPALNHTLTLGANATNSTSAAWTLRMPADAWNLTALQTVTSWAHDGLKTVARGLGASLGNGRKQRL